MNKNVCSLAMKKFNKPNADRAEDDVVRMSTGILNLHERSRA